MRVGGIDENADVGRVENILALRSGVHLVHTEAPEVVAVAVANIDDGSGRQQRDQGQRRQVRNNDDDTSPAGECRIVVSTLIGLKQSGHTCNRRGKKYEKPYHSSEI